MRARASGQDETRGNQTAKKDEFFHRVGLHFHESLEAESRPQHDSVGVIFQVGIDRLVETVGVRRNAVAGHEVPLGLQRKVLIEGNLCGHHFVVVVLLWPRVVEVERGAVWDQVRAANENAVMGVVRAAFEPFVDPKPAAPIPSARVRVEICGAAEDILVRFKSEASRELAPYRSRMSAVQLRQIEHQFVHKRLLEHFQLPRLSLFYMKQA